MQCLFQRLDKSHITFINSAMKQVVQALEGDKKYPVELDIAYTGFRTINWEQISADFEFTFGDRKVCRVQSFLAEALSPKIARMRKADASTDRYVFKDVSSGVYEAFESLVSQVRHGMPLQVEESRFEGLVRVCYELENNEILSSLIKIATLDIERAMSLLAFGGPASRCQPLIEFIASHFYEISEERLGMIDLETAWTILSHESLIIADENSVYDFVRSRVTTDSSFACLFEFVNFEYLSPDRINDFVPFAREYLLDHLNAAIWERICRRLVLSLPLECSPRTLKMQSHGQTAQSDTGRKCVYECVYTGDHISGIIAFLTRECGGNVHDLGIVEVTQTDPPPPDPYDNLPLLKRPSGCADEHALNRLVERRARRFLMHVRDHPRNVVSFENHDLCHATGPDAWICYDFLNSRVALTSYSIETNGSSSPGNHLRSWVLEQSNDKLSWVVVDRRENNSDLMDSFKIHNFSISSEPRDAFRYVRLRQTGRNHAGNDNLCISKLELFGKLFIEPTRK